jgi:SAM-dependent methyltransferase
VPQEIEKDRWTSGAGYDLWMGRWSRILADQFLKWLQVPARASWLDVCCGGGIVTQVIVEACSPAGVVGVDASPAQIAFAREKRIYPNVTFNVGDAMALPFQDASFDVAVCGLGLNFVPEQVGALREMRRVTRPGGTVAVYVWDYIQGARFVREFWDAALAVDREAIEFDQGRRFPWCTPQGLQQLFESAGLRQASVRALDIVMQFASFDDYWEPFLSGQGSAPAYLASRDEATRNAIRARLRVALPGKAKGAIELPARAWAARGTHA